MPDEEPYVAGYKTDHPVFTRPPRDTVLWRYQSLEKFLDLIARRELFFARADQVGDPWEGAVSELGLSVLAATLKEQQTISGQSDEQITELVTSLRSSVKRFAEQIYMSCWYADDDESMAMWKPGSASSTVIVVKSTFERLEAALPATFDYDIYAGRVTYVDYGKVPIPMGNMYAPFMFKRGAFKHEQEVRAVLSAGYGDASVYVPVDLERLIERVHVAPSTPDWRLEVTRLVVRQFGLDVPVERSSMDATPL